MRTSENQIADTDKTRPDLLTRSQAVSALAELRDQQDNFLQLATSGDIAKLSGEDHIVIAALARSLAIVDGFLTLVGCGNEFCAIPLIRFQLDSAMRIFACTLVADPTTFALHLLKGESPGKFKDRTGQLLTDSSLKTELAKVHRYADEVYHYTSGYVHLSNSHLIAVLNRNKSSSEALVFHDLKNPLKWNEDEICGALVNLIYATDILVAVCEDWQKRRTPAS